MDKPTAKYFQDSGSIKFYQPGKSAVNMDPFDCVVTIVWPTSDIAFAKSAKGRLPASYIDLMVAECKAAGARVIRVQRALTKRMPPGWRVVESTKKYNLWEIET